MGLQSPLWACWWVGFPRVMNTKVWLLNQQTYERKDMEYEIDEIWDYHILPPAQTCTIWHLYDIILVWKLVLKITDKLMVITHRYARNMSVTGTYLSSDVIKYHHFIISFAITVLASVKFTSPRPKNTKSYTLKRNSAPKTWERSWNSPVEQIQLV